MTNNSLNQLVQNYVSSELPELLQVDLSRKKVQEKSIKKIRENFSN